MSTFAGIAVGVTVARIGVLVVAEVAAGVLVVAEVAVGVLVVAEVAVGVPGVAEVAVGVLVVAEVAVDVLVATEVAVGVLVSGTVVPVGSGVLTPVPVNPMLCGLPNALLVTVSVSVREPATVGVKVTLIVQFAPAARVAAQVLVWAKSPLALMPAIFSTAEPLLVRVTLCAVLVVPFVCAAKVRLVGARLTAGAAAARILRLTLA